MQGRRLVLLGAVVAAVAACGGPPHTSELARVAPTVPPTGSATPAPPAPAPGLVGEERLREAVVAAVDGEFDLEGTRTFDSPTGTVVGATVVRPHGERTAVVDFMQSVIDDVGWQALLSDLGVQDEEVDDGWRLAVVTRGSQLQAVVLSPGGVLTNAAAGLLPARADESPPVNSDHLVAMARRVAIDTATSER